MKPTAVPLNETIFQISPILRLMRPNVDAPTHGRRTARHPSMMHEKPAVNLLPRCDPIKSVRRRSPPAEKSQRSLQRDHVTSKGNRVNPFHFEMPISPRSKRKQRLQPQRIISKALRPPLLYSGMKYLFAILCVALMGCATTQTTDPTATKGPPSADWSRHSLTH